MRLIVCLFFVGLAHLGSAQNGNSGFDFSSFNSATSSGSGASNLGANSLGGALGISSTSMTPAMGTNPNGMGTFGQAGQMNNIPSGSNMNTLGGQMNNGQMMNNGQFMNTQMSGQTMNGQIMNNGQVMNNAQMMNGQMGSGQIMNNGQFMNNQMMGPNGGVANMNGQMMQNGQMMSNGQMMPNGQNMIQNGMFQDPTRMGALSQQSFNSLAFNPNTQQGLFQNQLNSQNMPSFGGQQSQFGQGSPFMQSPFMGPRMIPGPFGAQSFGGFPASPFTGRPGFGIFQDPMMNAFAPPMPFLGQPQFMPPPMFDSNSNPVTAQQTTTGTSLQGQGPTFNSFLFPATQTGTSSTSFSFQPGMNNMLNTGMLATTTTQFFDATSGMPIGNPASVITTSTGQLVDGTTGLPVVANTMTMDPATGMQMSSMGGTNAGLGPFQPMVNQVSGQFSPTTNQNLMFTNTGMTGKKK